MSQKIALSSRGERVLLVTPPAMTPSLTVAPTLVVAVLLLQEMFNLLLLSVHNVHRFIGIVEIVPARRLVRGVAGPDLSKLIFVLGLGTVDTTISPWTSSNVSTDLSLKVVDCCSDNGLCIRQH